MIKVFLFMNQIKETPAYWKENSERSFGNGGKIRLLKIFLNIFCADLRWKELVEIISKLNSLCLTKENVEPLNYFERCNILNSNAVYLAQRF